jgi:2-phospho-L-lactate guanylyltransferase
MRPGGAETTVVLPVKRLDDAKHRLTALLAPPERRRLMTAMLDDVLDALERVEVTHELMVVTRDPDAADAARARRAMVVADAVDAGHSAAALVGIRAALDRGARRVLLIPGDCPLMAPADVEALLERPSTPGGGVVIVPDRAGAGTNALLLEPPDVIAPAFGPGSHARHRAAARHAGVAAETQRPGSLVLDVDTPDDLRALADALAERSGTAPRTAAVLAALSLAGSAAR